MFTMDKECSTALKRIPGMCVRVCLWNQAMKVKLNTLSYSVPVFVFYFLFSSVLYFSWHRYEHQQFWPNLAESDYDSVGKGKGAGFNINLPWNKVLLLE